MSQVAAVVKETESPPDLEWIQLCRDLEKTHKQETFIEKINRKNNENPFVPIGAALTTFALGYGLWAYKDGKVKTSQYMMRGRVLAQGFTIVAFVVGMVVTARKTS